MDYKQLSDELCQMHITYAGAINQALDRISAKGEDGIVLWLGQRKQDTFPTDIVKHFHLSPGRVANILKVLEQKGAIVRSPDPEDGRKVQVRLTEKGKAYARECYTGMVEQHTWLLETLGEKEAVHLARIMKQVLRMVEQGQIKAF